MQKNKILGVLRNCAVYLILASLLWWALRNAPLTEIWNALKQLQFWQIASLLGINAAIYALVTLRWWLIVHAENKNIRYFPLLAVRVSVFGVSYFTLGPQIGGEPLQVLYLRRKYGLTFTRAAASVILDKLLEFLANFVMLAVGLAAVAEAGILFTNGGPPIVSLSGLFVLLAWPPIHIILMSRGKYPVSFVLRKFSNNKFARFIAASERMAGAFCRRHLLELIFAILISLVAAAGMVGEFFLITIFLEIPLNFWQTISAWMAGWLAFLVPLPGGLGALEASLVFAFGAFSISAAPAISVALLIRTRDILIGGLGLILASRSFGK